MAANQTQRPKFYEEQYLGAADLTAAVDYGRIQNARHALGGHTWGIAMGLTLKEMPQPGGAVSVHLLPGYAWDGYGRPIVVLSPYRIPEEKFSGIKFDPAIDSSGEGRLIAVWLRYDETSFRNPPLGFASCNTADQYSRVVETFRIEIGDRPSVLDRYSAINVASKSLADARNALQTFDSSAPLVHDESVPHQTFPEPKDKARWLIPIGYVRWLPVLNQPGHFVARNDTADPKDSDQIRNLRHYIGVVAEGIEAADGRIRMKDRAKPFSTTRTSNDLVWVEGNLRIEGDVRLFDHKLDFRDSQGLDNKGIPLSIQRFDVPSKRSSLQVIIGQANKGDNTLAIGPLDNSGKFAEKVTLRDDGKVGIGTLSPDRLLTIQDDAGAYLNLKDKNGIHEVLLGADGGGGIVSTMTDHDLQLRAGKNTIQMVVKADGNVGIGTSSPDRKLTIAGASGTYLNVRSGGGVHEVLVGADGNGGIVSTMTNHDLQLRAGVNSTKVIIKADGNVGVGTTSPGFKLDVADRMRIRQGNSGTAGMWLFQANPNHDRAFIGMATDDEVGLWGNTGAQWGLVMNTSNGKVGIATLAPACKLHVSDSISGSAGDVSSHVAVIDNTDITGEADVLALKIGTGFPTTGNNFITFFAGNTAIAAIEGNGVGGVSFRSMGGADFAECLPLLNADEVMMEGDIVGIFGGKISKATTSASHVSVVTRRPIVVGNAPDPKSSRLCDQVSFLGQVPVRTRGPVQEGDYIVPSGLGDGIGLAVNPNRMEFDQYRQVVGQAWDSSSEEGVKMVTVAIGFSSAAPAAALAALVSNQQAELERLKEEIRAVQEGLR
ncbi:MAG: hypothetical protein ACJ74G_08825 [Blastocatellia bacterium]